MSQAFKLLDPNTGEIKFHDCLTGVELTAAQIATITPCPSVELTDDSVCIQPTGNTDPTLVETDAKRICTVQISYLADGTVDTTELLSTNLIDAAGADVTATHEVTACPAPLIPVGEVCFTA